MEWIKLKLVDFSFHLYKLIALIPIALSVALIQLFIVMIELPEIVNIVILIISGVLGFYFLGNIWGLIDERKEVYLKNQKNDAVIKSKSISEHQNFTKKEVKEDEANNIKKTAYSNLILLLVIILFFTILTITVSFYFLFVVMVFCFYGIYLNNIKNNQSSSYKKKTVLNETRKKESLKEKNKKIEQIEKSSFVESKKSENIIKKDNTINITSLSDDLIKLGELKEKGLLTEEEFNEQKKKLLKQ